MIQHNDANAGPVLVWFPDPSVMRMRITEGSGNQTSPVHDPQA